MHAHWRLLVALALSFAAGCNSPPGPGHAKVTDEQSIRAMDAGYTTQRNWRCHGIEATVMIPSEFDDSREEGRLVAAYRQGALRAESEPCP